MVYKAAYWPLLAGWLRSIQKLFIKGMEKISPKVNREIIKKATMGPKPGIFNIRKERPPINIPNEM